MRSPIVEPRICARFWERLLGAGSEVHSVAEIGTVYVEMDDFDAAQDFLTSLRKARIVKGRSKFILMAEARLSKIRPL
jgi:hypothetical protein